MPKQIVVLSAGPVASGKSTLAQALVDQHGYRPFRTKLMIQAARSVKSERRTLQRAGDALDRQTGGEWIAQTVAKEIQSLPEDASVVIDSVRIKLQVDAIRRAFGARVVHIHLTASEKVLESRYRRRQDGVQELDSYADVRRNRTERSVDELAKVADIVVDTERSSDTDVLVRVASRLGLYGRSVDRLVDVLIGGQYGSEGKGHVASYLAPEYDCLVRSGGPNAGHTIYEKPKPYRHHQLPSGTKSSEAKLIVAPGAVLWVDTLLKEIAECHVQSDRLSIDPQAMVMEASDRTAEARSLKKSIGSTAQG